MSCCERNPSGDPLTPRKQSLDLDSIRPDTARCIPRVLPLATRALLRFFPAAAPGLEAGAAFAAVGDGAEPGKQEACGGSIGGCEIR